MDASSSDELTSDSELDEIFESAWKKTSVSLTRDKITNKADLDPTVVSNSDPESDSEDQLPFVIDKTPARKDASTSKEEECIVLNTESHNRSDSESGGESDDGSSLFVIDKTPSAEGASTSKATTFIDDCDEGEKRLPKEKRNRGEHRNKNDRGKSDKSHSMELSSSLQVKSDPSDIYINFHSIHAPQPKYKTHIERLSKEHEEIMAKSVITPDFEKKDAIPTNEEGFRRKQKERKKAREQTKGRGWYNMPIGELTEEKKNDLIALKMRRALDPKRFYKGDDIKGLPKYFQFGTVVEDASEFYSARIPKKQQKTSIVEELMADAEFRKYNKRKYAEVQDLKAKGLGPYKGIRTTKIKRKKRK
ncbi:deoxynucleotidyltransferase terminal-interacting protein 2-like [Haliotis rufescens]|uniref:deoxynucleotidyltransferase terminal-interacting protein 2-like n=1 Tax=Haliotis rufescens TaxID=6454 RepID=UPI00201F3F8D|nr:deoxynucleotidyltransferase terminal-interacting protein 2-like [Haliotis rufescens]